MSREREPRPPADDGYLWQGSEPVDADVETFERLLAPLRHAAGARPPELARARGPVGGTGARWALAAVLCISLASAAAGWLWLTSGRIAVTVDGERVAWRVGERWVADGTRTVALGGVGRFEVEAGTELRLEQCDRARSSFFLERGALTAFVFPSVEARYFQVGTPAVRCVDLGCRYRLEVDDEGAARVHVTLGEVAFEEARRAVRVPRGNVCRASVGDGVCTPRAAVDAGTRFAALVDTYDRALAAGGARAGAAAALLSAATEARHSLVVWHLLQDSDAAVQAAGWRWLVARYGIAPGQRREPPASTSLAQREAWRLRIQGDWYL